MTTIQFDRRFTFIIHGQRKPLGEVCDYFARVECQNRGSVLSYLFMGEGYASWCEWKDTSTHTSIYFRHSTHIFHHKVMIYKYAIWWQSFKFIHNLNIVLKRWSPYRFGFPKRSCERYVFIPHIVAVKSTYIWLLIHYSLMHITQTYCATGEQT